MYQSNGLATRDLEAHTAQRRHIRGVRVGEVHVVKFNAAIAEIGVGSEGLDTDEMIQK